MQIWAQLLVVVGPQEHVSLTLCEVTVAGGTQRRGCIGAKPGGNEGTCLLCQGVQAVELEAEARVQGC